jgi:hypothetical protein
VEASVPHSRALCEVLFEPLLARVELKAPDPLRSLTHIAAKYGNSDASVFAAAYTELGDRTHNVTAPMIDKALSKARGRHATHILYTATDAAAARASMRGEDVDLRAYREGDPVFEAWREQHPGDYWLGRIIKLSAADADKYLQGSAA